MSADARPRRTRPNGAPAYYLGRPASAWIAITIRRPGKPDPAVKHPDLYRRADHRPAIPHGGPMAAATPP
jgi:hypothetical protein